MYLKVGLRDYSLKTNNRVDRLMISNGNHDRLNKAQNSENEKPRFRVAAGGDHLRAMICPYRTAAGSHLLYRLIHPVVLINQYREILYQTKLSEARLSECDALCLEGGALRCSSHEDDRRLSGTISDLAFLKNAEMSVHPFALRTQKTCSDKAVLLLIDRVFLSDDEFGLHTDPVISVVVHALTPTRKLHPGLIAEAFDLTTAESEICALMALGFSSIEIATERNVSLLTVRTQIKLIREKMGVNNQANLVRRLCELPQFPAFPATQISVGQARDNQSRYIASDGLYPAG